MFADLASKCTIVFSMLLNDEVLKSTFDAFLAALPMPGLLKAQIWSDCSTIYPGVSADLAAKGAAKGVAFLSTPIFGRPDAVQRHDGLLVCAGDPAARERVSPLVCLSKALQIPPPSRYEACTCDRCGLCWTALAKGSYTAAIAPPMALP